MLEFKNGADVVIGGDFNLVVSQRHQSEERETPGGARKIQARLRDEFGLLNCWQTANPNRPLPQTLRWSNQPDIPYHCDGIFVPVNWGDRLRSCEVISGKLWNSLSDHNPVFAEID